MSLSWQESTIAQLKAYLESFEAVQAAFLVGSLADDALQPDDWSDIDLVVVVTDSAIHSFYPQTDWLRPILPIYATSQSAAPPRYTLRVCSTDMHRVDFIFILASAWYDPKQPGVHRFQARRRVLFDKSPQTQKAVLQSPGSPERSPDPETQFSTMSNAFWFKGQLAVYKVVRNDLLIALHLAFDLLRDCLVLRMMLRDRDQGTRHHRIGGPGNELVDQMGRVTTETSPAGILMMIENASQIFDGLAAEWSPGYVARQGPLINWIRQAETELIKRH